MVCPHVVLSLPLRLPDSIPLPIDDLPLSKTKTTLEENKILRLDDVFSFLADGIFEEKIVDLDECSKRELGLGRRKSSSP